MMMHALLPCTGKGRSTGYVFDRYFKVLQSERTLPETTWTRQKARLIVRTPGWRPDNGLVFARISCERINILCRCSTPVAAPQGRCDCLLEAPWRVIIIVRYLSCETDMKISRDSLDTRGGGGGVCTQSPSWDLTHVADPFRAIRAVSYYHEYLAISQFQGAILTSAIIRTRVFFFLSSEEAFLSVRSAVPVWKRILV